MISFRHKSNTKQIKIKSKRDLNERMSPWLQGIFGIKNPIVGFKTSNNKYYDTETFYNNKQKFYGQIVDIIQAKDQLQISFVSDNLNSSSNIRNAAPLFTEDFQEQTEQTYRLVTDIRGVERRLQENGELTIIFNIHQIYKNEIVESINMIKLQNNGKIGFYMRIIPNKANQQACYHIYVGKKLVATLNLTRQYRQTIQMVIERYAKKLKKVQAQKSEKLAYRQQQQNIFKVSYEQQNQAPSFTTYQLQQRLNQDAVHDYLLRMYQEKVLKKYEYLKLNEKCEENFIEFYRIFCEGAIDNDYQNFKNQVKTKVDNNLQLLLTNVDEMDLSRPISRQQQRKQNLKKSVPSIEIVKVQNYFQILDQLKPLLMPQTFALIKAQLLDQNQTVFSGFSDYLSRKFSKQQLANFLQKAVQKNQKRPVSRCLPRSANRNRQLAYNSEDQILINPSVNFRQVQYNRPTQKIQKLSAPPIVEPQKQEPQIIKLIGNSNPAGSGSKQNKNDNKEIPPMFGASKQQNNFSPIKYMSDIQSNYKQAWTRLENKGDFFQPEEYGLLYYYLQTRDDSISNHIQQLQWNQQQSIDNLKNFLSNRMIQIMEQNFNQEELNFLATFRDTQQINCIYQNFKYESDLTKFLSAIHAQLSKFISKSPSISPSHTHNPGHQKYQVLTKKSSDSKLLNKHKKSVRKYSDEQQQITSPKQSSFSHPKTNQMMGVQLQILNCFWADQLQEMIQHCSFSEQQREQYIREAFKQGNPSIYAWINNFIQGKMDVFKDKSTLKVKEQQNRYMMKLVPIFSQILKSFVDEGRISDKIRKWCVAQLIELNLAIVGAFECYIKIKNPQQFLDTISSCFQLQNNEMQYYRGYLKRIEQVLRQMSAHDPISIEVFKLYPKQIKAICEVYFITGGIEELLDNLDVLYQVEVKRRKLKMATLNFSGINLNPFQYYDGSQQLEKISQNMKTILDTQRQFIDNKLSLIDKFYSTNSMSIRFGDKMCQSDHLMSRKQFCAKWKQYYEKYKPQQIKDDSPDVVQSAMLFDYYCYLSTVKYVYGVQWKVKDYQDKLYKFCKNDYEVEGIQKLQAIKLRQFLSKERSRPASKISQKFSMVIEYLMKNQLDIMFMQQAGTVNWGEQLVHQYSWHRGGDSVIIYKKDKFGSPRSDLKKIYESKLNFNNDSAFIFTDRGYLLLSVHFKSNQQFYRVQAQQMFTQLIQVFQQHPMLKIIIGMDANHFIGDTKNIFLNFVPKTKQEFTTNKMRSYLQVQFRKARQRSKSGKDYIVTNLDIKDYVIQMINGEIPTDNSTIPSYQHPYDHFIVRAIVQNSSLNILPNYPFEQQQTDLQTI